ncbi:MAG: hypothetical protein KJN92_01090, partial [Gemmatimonadetes bacterium]|nr:hypothetical protein [Gemmatimonadota bacterium]
MPEGHAELEARLGTWLAELGSAEHALNLLETAEGLLGATGAAGVPPDVWHRYLNETRRPEFLQALPDPATRERWAETAFSAIQESRFDLEALFEQRVREHPERTLFQEMDGRESRLWSY